MTRIQEAIVLALMVCSFAFGYLAHRSAAPVEVKDQITEVKDNHTVVTTVTSKQANGDIKVIKTIDSATKLKETDKKDTVAPASSPKWNVSAMAGYDFTKPKDLVPIYGVSVNRQVLGPFTIGAYGMTDGIIGLSIGASF